MQTNRDNVSRSIDSKKCDDAEIHNAKHVSDVEYAIQMNRWFLKPLGLWPMGVEKRLWDRIVAKMLVVACTLVLFWVLITGSLYTFVKEKNTTIKLKLFGFLSFCLMAILKYGSLVGNRRDIGKCIEHIATDWRRIERDDDHRTMMDHALFGRYGAAICMGFMYPGGIFYVGVMPLLTGTIFIPELNVTIRPLPYPGYFVFFDPQISPNYQFVFATHIGCAFVMHTTATAVCGIAVIFVMHACGQLKILRRWLDCLVDDDDRVGKKNNLADTVDARLGIIVAQHVRTLSFIFQTEKILRNVCLVELVGCTLNLCLLGFDLLTEWNHSGPVAMLTYVILITSFLFNIFLFCYIGEILTEECKKIGEKSYMIDWYKMPGKTALGLTLTIAMAENPVTITAGRLMELSLTTFCSVIKTSVGYLNILRTLTA